MGVYREVFITITLEHLFWNKNNENILQFLESCGFLNDISILANNYNTHFREHFAMYGAW